MRLRNYLKQTLIRQSMFKKNYVPKYSLSIKILSKVMSKKDFKELMVKYIAQKKADWGKYNK